MAAKVVAVYDRHQALFDADARSVWKGRPNPFRLPNLHITGSTAESMAINRIENGAIVIAGSGMANGGRILHHFRHNIDRRGTHVVFVGYQSEGTLGRRLVDGAKWVRIHGQDHRVNAQVHTIGGLSAHTDQRADGLYEGLKPSAVVLLSREDRARALAGGGRARWRDVRLARRGW